MDSIGPYKIIHEIGSGGSGIVYLARHKELGILKAVKVIRPELIGDEAAIESFRRGAFAVSVLTDHPNLLTGEYGRDGDIVYLVMPYLPKGSLARSENREGFSADPRAALRLMIKVASAIQYANRRGFIHRDLKPENILINDEGEPQVVDFGLAAFTEEGSEWTKDHPPGSTDQKGRAQTPNPTVTMTADFMGTARWASPEMARRYRNAGNNSARPESPALIPMDVYGLGIVLYYLITDHIPYPGEDFENVMRDVADPSFKPKNIQEISPGIPRDLKCVMDVAMHDQPEQRFSNSGGFREDLERLLHGEPVKSSNPSIFRRGRLWTLRNKALFTVGVLTAILAVAGVVYGWKANSRLLEAKREILQVVKLDSVIIKYKISELARPLIPLSTDPKLVSATKNANRSYLQDWIEKQHRRSQEVGSISSYASWFIVDESGEMLARSPQSAVHLPAEVVRERDYFKGAKDKSDEKGAAKIHRSSFVFKSLLDSDYVYKFGLSAPIDSKEDFEGVLVFSVPTSGSFGIPELQNEEYRLALLAPMDPSSEGNEASKGRHVFVIHPRYQFGQKAVEAPPDLQVKIDNLVEEISFVGYVDPLEDWEGQKGAILVAALARVPGTNFVVLGWSPLSL